MQDLLRACSQRGNVISQISVTAMEPSHPVSRLALCSLHLSSLVFFFSGPAPLSSS